MHRILALIIGLALAVSLASGAVAHAVEGSPGTAPSYADCGADTHTDDDSDGADPDQATPHFHGCHGHHIGVPSVTGDPVNLIAASRALHVGDDHPRRQSPPNEMLRPPMA